MTEQHAERRLITPRLVGSCGLVARSRPRFSSAVSFELGGKGGFIAAVRRLPQLDLQLATPPYSNRPIRGKWTLISSANTGRDVIFNCGGQLKWNVSFNH
ncbi:hypothetical protein T05_3117 [Trichinella murrelli]|uniref:Uncharacterized protein n=1 Tax=Trichinella murrelli TaxID=144512 RepID=A0A0V0U0A0_9BILA|nr:hypothetical protein T05_3117 [Trichinella murrelli]